VDLSPSSSAEYLANPELYGFLPDLSISSIGPVASVLLFSRLPIESLDRRVVGLSPASATSVMMLRVLLEGRLGLRPEYCAPEEADDAVLWIGDRALAEAGRGRWEHAYDLGALWFRYTGTPFVFALWIARREAFGKNPGGLRSFYRKLVEARQRAYRSYDQYSRRAPEAAWLGERALLEYWLTLSYDLTAWHLRGLRRFAEEAAALGLIPGVPSLTPLAVEE
jgi:chorismate dehydratase